MKKFVEFVSLRENDTGLHEKHIISHIMEIAWTRHRSDVEDFIEQLADRDPEIQQEYAKIRMQKPEDMKKGKLSHEPEIVAPAAADINQGLDN